MKRSIVIFFFMAIPAPATMAQKEDPVKKELKALQGTWTLVFFENDRQLLERKGIEREFKKGELRLQIEGDKVSLEQGERTQSFTFRKGGKPKDGTFHVDPAASPKRVEFSQGGGGGLFGGLITFKGIYRHMGDRLEICVVWSDRAEPPLDFTMKPGVEWRWLLVYERIKK